MALLFSGYYMTGHNQSTWQGQLQPQVLSSCTFVFCLHHYELTVSRCLSRLHEAAWEHQVSLLHLVGSFRQFVISLRRQRFSLRENDFHFPVMNSMCTPHQSQVASWKQTGYCEAKYRGSKVKKCRHVWKDPKWTLEADYLITISKLFKQHLYRNESVPSFLIHISS